MNQDIKVSIMIGVSLFLLSACSQLDEAETQADSSQEHVVDNKMNPFDSIQTVKPEIECNANKTNCKTLNLDLPEGIENVPEDAFYDDEGNLFLSFWQEDHFDFYKNADHVVSVPIYFGTDGPIWNLGLIDGELSFEYSTRKNEKMVMDLYYERESMNEKYDLDGSKELFLYKDKLGFVARKNEDYFIWFNEQKISEDFEEVRTRACCDVPIFPFELQEDGTLFFGATQAGEYKEFEVDLNDFL